MPEIQSLLLDGEVVRERITYGGVTVAVTSRGLLASDSRGVYAINPRHVSTVGYGYALNEFIAGGILAVISPVLTIISDWLALILLLIGLTLAIYGWMYRHRLFITYLGGTITLRGGGAVPLMAKRLRRIIEELNIKE